MSKVPPGVDNFEMTNITEVRGYYSSIDPTTAPANVMVRGSQNVYKTSNRTLANRPGRKQYDSLDATLAGIKTAYVWNTSLGKHLAMRIANSKLQVMSDIVTSGTFVWYDLLTSLAKTRGVFDAWWNNTLKKDQLITVIGDSNLYMWDGGIEKISSTTVNTIVLTSDAALAGFNTSGGSVLINGNSYTYAAISGSTLTGVGSDPRGEANGSVVLMKPVTTSNSPVSGFNNDFIKVIGNRLHIGSYTSRLVYISSNSNYTNFSVPSPRTPGDPELLTLDSTGQGIGVRQGDAHIFAGNSELYIVSYEKITVGTTLTEQTNVDKKQLGTLTTAYAHEFIDVLGDNIVYLSQDQQLRSFGTFRNLNQPVPPILSEEISTDLANETFTGGQLKVISGGDKGDIIYIIAPNSGIVYLHQTRTQVNSLGNVTAERLWHSPFIWGISRVDSLNGTVVGFSNSNPQMYQLWDTLQWHDDGVGAGSLAIQLAYTSILLMPYRSYGRRQGKIRFDKLFLEGYMTQGTALYGAIYFDYQGATGVLSPIIHSIIDNSPAPVASFFTGITPPSLGDSSLGDNPLGDATAVIMGTEIIRDHDLVPKFRIIVGVELTDCFEFAPMVFTSKTDDRWEIIALGANVSEAPFNAVEITK